jgi:hypothetical protein
MSDDVDHPTSSGTHRTFGTPGTGRIVEAIARAESHVARMSPSPTTDHLSALLNDFRRTLRGWEVSPPTDDEFLSVERRVVQVLQLASTTSPTIRLRRPA